MSRTGPEYVESEKELYNDLERKQSNGEITERTAKAFLELYEFAKDLGDEVTIGGAKNANFQMKVDAHQGGFSGDTSVFTANVSGELRVWPAGRPFANNSLSASVAWDEQDYNDYKRQFQSLNGVPRGKSKVNFETAASEVDLDRFKVIVEEFIATCQQKVLGSA